MKAEIDETLFRRIVVRPLMSWIVANIVPFLNVVGIFFDIIGAVLVSIEVVNQFRGKQYRDQFTFDSSVTLAPPETDQYKAWAYLKTRTMRFGLACLVFGLLLQLVANVLQFKCAP
jgi:hypothetical protein